MLTRFLAWLTLGRNAVRHTLVLGLLIGGVQSALLLVASTLDGTLRPPGPELGLLEHPGVVAIVLADGVLLALLGYAARRFLRSSIRMPVVDSPRNRRYLRQAVSRGRAVLLLRGRARSLFLVCAGLGVLFWLLNAVQTRDPVTFYGRDVFDSSLHPYSYVVMRIVLGLSWVVLYPYAAVGFLGISGNLYRVTLGLAKRGQLRYKLFHPDSCGGFSIIGEISFAAIMAVLALYTSLTTVIVTHQKLSVLQISGFVCLSTMFVVLTFLISWPTTRFLMERRRQDRQGSYRRLSSQRDTFAAVKLVWIATSASYSPYAAYQRGLINAARALPVILGGIRIYDMI